MPSPLISEASTTWKGDLISGSGETSLDSSGLATFTVGWKARAEAHQGQTTPEELIAAAHASCFSMALSHALAGAGTPPDLLETSASVTFMAGKGITGIVLSVTGHVPGISAEDFERIAGEAKEGCPVSQALTGTEIHLEASLA